MVNIVGIIGTTPIVELRQNKNIFLKLEFLNPGGSVKDRIAYFMVKDAIERNMLKEGDTIVEPTSGNTGISLAMVSKTFGIKVILTMPDSLSKERISLMEAYGALVILTEGAKRMDGAIEKAHELIETGKAKLMLQQFENPANPLAHELTTGPEILRQMNYDVDAFVAGVGTGGTITGVARIVKKFIRNIKIFAVEPSQSPVLSHGKPGSHTIEGIGAGFIPKVLDLKLIDDVICIDQDEARQAARELAREEGILAGPSSGANILGARLVSEKYNFKRVLTIAPDRGERYLSENLFTL